MNTRKQGNMKHGGRCQNSLAGAQGAVEVDHPLNSRPEAPLRHLPWRKSKAFGLHSRPGEGFLPLFPTPQEAPQVGGCVSGSEAGNFHASFPCFLPHYFFLLPYSLDNFCYMPILFTHKGEYVWWTQLLPNPICACLLGFPSHRQLL